MPRNPDLRVVRQAREIDSQMAVILITGYPSTETAIQSVEMSVVSYLTKPLDFEDLLSRVQKAVEQSRNRRVLSSVHRRLGSCLSDLEQTLSVGPPHATEPVSIATIRTLASCLSELLELAARNRADWTSDNLCHLLDCP
jgi:DNA-binding response OmpR family regulator